MRMLYSTSSASCVHILVLVRTELNRSQTCASAQSNLHFELAIRIEPRCLNESRYTSGKMLTHDT